jgi:hypothetical protein
MDGGVDVQRVVSAVGLSRSPLATATRTGEDVAIMLFASLLPGLRALRAPLAAGYIALLAAFLLAGGHFASEESATGLVKSFYDASDVIGKAGVLAAISFVAYLIGSVISDAGTAFFDRFGRSITDRGGWSLIELSARAIQEAEDGAKRDQRPDISDHLDETARAALGNTPSGSIGAMALEGADTPVRKFFRERTEFYFAGDRRAEYESLAIALSYRTYTEFDRILMRLLGREPELHSAVDRLRSEAELRQAIAPALVLLSIGLGFSGLVGAAVALLVAVPVLLNQAGRRRIAASDLLADALVLQRVAAPTIERFLRLNGIDWSDRTPEPATRTDVRA